MLPTLRKLTRQRLVQSWMVVRSTSTLQTPAAREDSKTVLNLAQSPLATKQAHPPTLSSSGISALTPDKKPFPKHSPTSAPSCQSGFLRIVRPEHQKGSATLASPRWMKPRGHWKVCKVGISREDHVVSTSANLDQAMATPRLVEDVAAVVAASAGGAVAEVASVTVVDAAVGGDEGLVTVVDEAAAAAALIVAALATMLARRRLSKCVGLVCLLQLIPSAPLCSLRWHSHNSDILLHTHKQDSLAEAEVSISLGTNA